MGVAEDLELHKAARWARVQSFCQSARLDSIRKLTSTHPFHPQAVMELLTTQTGALAQSPREVEHRRGSRAKYKILVGFLDVTVNY